MSKLAGGSVSGGRRCTEGLAVPADAPSASPGKAYRGREEQAGAGLREADERGGRPGCSAAGSSSGGGRGQRGPQKGLCPQPRSARGRLAGLGGVTWPSGPC